MAYKKDTVCVQAGYEPKNGEPRVLPIYQSTTFAYETSQGMGDLFDLKADGFFYSRLANPTVAAVERKINELEGGVGAMLCSSGQSASMSAICNIVHAGQHVVCSSAVYGGTFNLLFVTLKQLGIDSTFVSPDCTEGELDAAFKPETRLVFGESVSNPSLNVLDFDKFVSAAHRHGVPCAVDNTFPTPINCRPFEMGVDIVTHSTTKYMDGHACVLGGVVVDGGSFDWDAHADKFPMLTTPDESYHGLIYTKAFGKAAYITKARVHLMRDMGMMMSPNSAFLLNLGLETLALRMERHNSNALALAEALTKEKNVAWVSYPALAGDKEFDKCQKYMGGKPGGVISFGVKGGRAAAEKFMGNLKLARIVTHVADARTCVLHPASSTHRQMDDEQLIACGIRPEMVRFSCGIENIEDIRQDVVNALNAL